MNPQGQFRLTFRYLALFLTVFIVSVAVLTGQQAEYPQLQTLVQNDQLSEATAMIERELADHPMHPELLYWKAVVAKKSNQTDAAEQTLLPLLESEQASVPHYLLLADIYNERSEWKKSAELYRQALILKYDPRLAVNLGLAQFRGHDYQGAIETLEGLLESPQAGASVHHLIGLSYMGLRELDTALKYLKEATEKRPQHAPYHYDYALALLQAKRLDEAVAEFRRTIELEPDWPEAHLYLGRALHDLNYADDALAAFKKAQMLKPDLPLLHHHFGLLHKGRGDYDKAIREFQAEIKSGRPYPPTFFHLADILLKRSDLEMAGDLIEQANQLDSNNSEYRQLAAKIALEKNDLDRAAHEVERAIQLDPNSGQAYYVQGRILKALGKMDEAQQAFEKSRALLDQRSGRRPRR